VSSYSQNTHPGGGKVAVALLIALVAIGANSLEVSREGLFHQVGKEVLEGSSLGVTQAVTTFV